ncbi:MAG: TonB-dependent receptor plug domain-containing protein [Woeseiaceae bacterium]|nr:TonB-dependent receptor plug domain-containing protein [Woeseiaceae bacterium]
MKKSLASSLALTAAVLVLPAPATAQLAEALIEEITVTAAKREQSIYEVPIAVSAFDGDKLAEQGIVNFYDVGKFVPNLNITEFSAGHTSSTNAFIRGIGLQDHLITTDPGVSVYVDGVYLGRQVGQNWNLTNLERIEVLRGPQGTLYGRNSIGGAINLITKTPGEDPGARVSVEYGSRDRLNGDFYADTALGDNAAISLTGGFKNRGGIGDFVNLPNAGLEVGETKEVFGRIALRFDLNNNATLTIAADANDGEGGLRPYTTLIDELGAACRAAAADPNDCAGVGNANGAVYDAGYRNSDVAADPYNNNTGQASQTLVTNEATGLSLTLDWDLSDTLNSKVILSQRQSEYKAGLDDDSFFDNFLSFPETGEADQTSFEIQLNGNYDNWDFVSGFYYFNEEGSNFQDGYTFNSFGLFDFYLAQEVTSIALFGNVGYNVSDALRITGGLRFTDDEKDAETEVGIGLVRASRSFDEVSAELSANYTLNNGMNVYGTIQSGYQSGQFPARPFCLFDDPGCFVASDNITAVNYEVGIKGQPLNNFQMSAAVFFTQYSDLPYQVSQTTGNGFDTANLIVDQDSIGFEWENTLYLTENFLFNASLGYIDVEVDGNSATNPVVAPLTPELTASISPEAHFPLNGGGEIVLRADYSYRDDMYGEPTSDPARFSRIESRDLINFDFAYHSPDGSFTAAVYGRNATDERYDNARLNLGDYVLQILSNDASEFGVRFRKDF